MITVVDPLQRTVRFSFPPQRIISLCPSITETLYAFGLGERIVGRTRFCVHPENDVKGAAIVGGTKQVKEDRIAELQPDLIIAEKEENPKDMVERLAARHPVYVANVESVSDALQMIADVGAVCGREELANSIAEEIRSKFQNIVPLERPLKAAYVIWKKPYMVAGHSTYIHSMLELCGFTNVFHDFPERYPTVTLDDFRRMKPEVILLSSEPYPFKDRDKEEFANEVLGAIPHLVDGEMVSWYGARMSQAADAVNRLIQKLR